MARFVKVISVVLLIMMLVGSFALGNVFQIVTPPKYSFEEAVYTYNVGAALGGVLASLMVFSVLLALSGILKRLDDIRACLRGK